MINTKQQTRPEISLFFEEVTEYMFESHPRGCTEFCISFIIIGNCGHKPIGSNSIVSFS